MKWLSRIVGRRKSGEEPDQAVELTPRKNEDALVSEAIAAIARGDKDGEQQFQSAFLNAEIGVMLSGMRQGLESGSTINSSDHQLSCHWGTDDHGHPVLLAFADPVEFEKNFGEKFSRDFGLQINATMPGIDAVRAALHSPQGHGIRINSAISDQSIVVRRDMLNSMLQDHEKNYSGVIAESVKSDLADMNDTPTGVVPDGTRIEEWQYLPGTGLVQSELGFWVVNFGATPLTTNILQAVKELEEFQKGVVFFFLSSETVGQIYVFKEITRFAKAQRDRWAITVCVAKVNDTVREQMSALDSLGVSVFSAAPDGTCVVEVHGPGGRKFGMAGQPFAKISWV